VPAGAPPRAVSSSASHALASTGAAPLWTGIGGLAVLLSGGLLLLFGRRRRG
jgi:LPXTG-motif cell wall-anchored protein